MARDFNLPNGSARFPLLSLSSSTRRRLRQTWRKRLKYASKLATSLQKRSCNLIAVLLSAVLLCVATYVLLSFSFRHRSSFDDVEDMRLIAEEDEAFVQRKQNETNQEVGDPLRNLNATDVHESRLTFDQVWAEHVRKPVRPILTKYRTRLMRELFARTHYVVTNKYAPAMDVSCNYLNDISDEGSSHSFECADTSHRCPDGSYSLQQVFAPKEGSSVTWDDIVIIILTSAGQEPYLEAAAETWISRLHPNATLLFARDGQEPELPMSISARPNIHVYEYPGPYGLMDLDLKALQTLHEAHKTYAQKGKKYFIKIDDDSFLFGHNLIRFLNKVEHWFSGKEQALYFGHPFCGHGDLEALGYERWCYAGGGAYGLSVEAVQILLTQIKGGCVYFYDYVAKASDWHPVNDKYGGRYEDVMVGRCLRQARTRLQTRGTSLLACGSFFPYAPLHYYEAFGQSVDVMCNKLQGHPITIHNLEPSAIRFMDHILFEYPLGEDITPFSPENERIQELIDVCHMNGKKMACDLSKVSLL